MTADEFLALLQSQAADFTQAVSTTDGEWIVKGFVDVYQRVYAISLDTKVVSKVLEVLLYPALRDFAATNGFTLELPPQQNFYPDLTFVFSDGTRFAVDIKSTYPTRANRVNGMTLGAFTGYFRNRESGKNTLYPYGQYAGHFVLGVVYSQNPAQEPDDAVYTLNALETMPSAIRSFTFFAQPKYRIASALPGSGNTKNIGSVVEIDRLVSGTGVFATLGEEVYDDYWTFYLTADMARTAAIPRPYSNLATYLEYKQRGIAALQHAAEIIASENITATDEAEDA